MPTSRDPHGAETSLPYTKRVLSDPNRGEIHPPSQRQAGPQWAGLQAGNQVAISRCIAWRNAYATTTGILPILACHSRGPVLWTDSPVESTATVTGMSSTVNS